MAAAALPAAAARGAPEQRRLPPARSTLQRARAPRSRASSTARRNEHDRRGDDARPSENTGCLRAGFPQVDFDNTVWYDIYPHRPGLVRVVVESASFAAVVGLMPFNASNAVAEHLTRYRCVGRRAWARPRWTTSSSSTKAGPTRSRWVASSGVQGPFSPQRLLLPRHRPRRGMSTAWTPARTRAART